ncbi:hypothetical protein F4801DRAFT_598423 [Xylaria longipes]|nr:hypothetical protein F4801DRAFT_598423 [Xylaria longipes]RYC63811.1 hypothetical protein CHU98_g2380 [Xylaria longipes]
MDSFLATLEYLNSTSQPTQLGDFPILVAGFGDDGFMFRSEGVWKPADLVVDNGMRRGYSVYSSNVLVGSGSLIVYDEIDREIDILFGGPLSCGWATNFPVDYILPPDHIVARYQEGKKAFREDFMTWPLLGNTNTDDEIASSVGQSVYSLAASDPVTQYGLGETEISQKTKFSIGFNGTSHRLPTITSNLKYYSMISRGQNVTSHPYPLAEPDDDDARSDASSATLGRSSDGGYA